MSDHLIAEANRHAKTLPQMTLPTTKANDRDLAWYIAECIDLKKQLEMECAAKREHMRIACAEINELKVRARVLEQENAALRKMLSDADELERYTGSNGKRQWGKCSAWLHPDDAVVIISAKALDAARKEAQP